MYKVLIVEDEEMIRKGLRYMTDWIKSDCIVIDEAADGCEGLERIRQLKPDIVIADITMPVMDGIAMIENSIDEFIYSAIIISGYDEFDYAQKAIKLGVSEYLLKPVEQEQLFQALERAKEQVRLKKQYKIIKNNLESIENIEVIGKELFEKDVKVSSQVAKMLDYIQKNYNKKISITYLVQILGMSDTYLNNKFKEETTYTFNEFLNRYRIQKSIDLMKTGEGKIYNIAALVGFSDYRYFISVFKKYTKCLPRDFLEYFKNRKY